MAKKKILIVESSNLIYAFLKKTIAPLNYETLHAKTYLETEELLEQHSEIDVALIAMDLPKKTEESIDLVLKKRIPTILLHGIEEEDERKNLLTKEIIDYVGKETKEDFSAIIKLIQRLEKNKEEKILVVDDSKTIRVYIASLLKRHRFITLQAADGQEALDVLKEHPDIKLIITDYEMPGMDGLGLIQNTRKAFDASSLPIIVVSSLEGKSTIVTCLKNGANDYLHKPFEPEEFFSRLYINLSNKENIDAISEQKEALEELSRTLESRVREEVEKNKKQTSSMVQQSRLAQMGEMISMIAHQWRQPLASISAISGTLTLDVMMDTYKKEFFQERLDAITDLAQHLSSTIDDFRGFFKETKKKTPTTWKEMADGSLTIIGPTLTTKDITVHTDYSADTSITTHPNEVKQVVLNILKNAEDIFLDKKTADAQIWIQSHITQEMATLSIRDNAGGIPEAIIDKVFDPYFSTKKQKDGTGLGLYMSKTIIEEHCGGRLSVYSTKEGAVFEIALPLDEERTE